MGATSSKVSSDQHVTNMLNECTNVMATVSNQSSGSQTVTQEGKYTILNSKVGNIGQDSKQTINLTAMLTNNSQAAVSDQISTALTSYVNQQSTAGGTIGNINSSSSKSSTFSTNINNIATNIKLNTLQTCMTAQLAAQKLDVTIISSEVGNILQTASQDAVQKCIMQNDTVATSLKAIATDLSASTTSTSTAGFDVTTMVMYIAIACVALGVLGLSIKLIAGRSSNDTKAVTAAPPPIPTAATATVLPAIAPTPAQAISQTANVMNSAQNNQALLATLANPETLKSLTSLAKMVLK